MRRTAILAAALIMLSGGAGQATEPHDTITLKRIEGEPLISFATRFFYKRHPHAVNWSFAKHYRSDENWAEIVRAQVYAAEADLNGDGVAELFLVVDNPNWCEADGCLGAIFRKAARGYELICETTCPAPRDAGRDDPGRDRERLSPPAMADATILWNARQGLRFGRVVFGGG